MSIFESAGFSIESEIDLPGLRARPPSDKPADLVFVKGDVPEIPAALKSEQRFRYFDGENFWLEAKDVGTFYIPKSGPVVVDILETASEHDAAIYLIGTVLGIALHVHEKIALHASAVLVDGKAVLFSGPSGAGKSTIVAALEGLGYPVLSDDLCALEINENGISTRSDGRLLKLWQTSLDGLGLEHRRGGSIGQRLDKFYVSHGEPMPDSVPVSKVYFLRETPKSEPTRIENLGFPDCAPAVVRNAYRPGLIKQLGQQALYLKAAASLARYAEMHMLHRPKDFEQVPHVLDVLQTHWSSS